MSGSHYQYKYYKYRSKYSNLVKTLEMLGGADGLCCRCRQATSKPSNELGGKYGGVVCVNHRSCYKCWFESEWNYGERASENEKTRAIPLVYGPRKGQQPECFGCLNSHPHHESAQPPPTVTITGKGKSGQPFQLGDTDDD